MKKSVYVMKALALGVLALQPDKEKLVSIEVVKPQEEPLATDVLTETQFEQLVKDGVLKLPDETAPAGTAAAEKPAKKT